MSALAIWTRAAAARRIGLRLAIGLLAVSPALAAAPAASGPSSFLPGASSKEPISIDADKLVYSDKEQKAVYTGNVVVIQGETKLTCWAMTILMAKAEAANGKAAAAPGPAAPAPTDAAAAAPDSTPGAGASQVRHMDAVGPVTVVSKTQVATGDSGSYDKEQNKVWLIGHVTLSDGGNVTKGDRLTYDLTSGVATVDNGKTNGRVHGQFIPGSNDNGSPTPAKSGK
jgi:lipopolysaccharide export system protein LptA